MSLCKIAAVVEDQAWGCTNNINQHNQFHTNLDPNNHPDKKEVLAKWLYNTGNG